MPSSHVGQDLRSGAHSAGSTRVETTLDSGDGLYLLLRLPFEGSREQHLNDSVQVLALSLGTVTQARF